MTTRIADQGLVLSITPPAASLLVDKGFDPHLGARPLRRAIQRLIQDPLSLAILNGEFGEGDTITVDRDGDKAAVRFERKVLEPALN